MAELEQESIIIVVRAVEGEAAFIHLINTYKAPAMRQTLCSAACAVMELTV